MPKGKSYDLKPRTNRRDYYCIVCEEVFCIFTGRRSLRSKTPFCPWCGEDLDVEKHKPLKHGGVTGRKWWTLKELDMLKELLQQPLTWEQITERFEGKRRLPAIRKAAVDNGLEKKFDMSGRRGLSEEIQRKIFADTRSAATVAKEYGVDIKTVYNVRKRLGGEQTIVQA